MTHPRNRRFAPVLLMGLLAAACSAGYEAEAPAAGMPADHPSIPSAGGAPSNQAVVVETMDAGGYTYALLALGDDEMWTAGPETELAVGDTVAVSGPMPMSNFHSSTLDRTFDAILFVDGYVKGAAALASAPSAPAGRQGTVVQSMDAAGYTYVEVEVDGANLWLAGPQTVLAEGDLVGWGEEMPMPGFTSRTLDRTFDELIFVNQLTVVR